MGHTQLLIVDDDPEMRQILARFLGQEGFKVHHACDAAGVNAVPLDDIDLVLCDVNLPDLSGFDLARRLRETHPNIGLIIVSGRGDLLDRVLGLEMGADDYIQKPFEFRELLARIRSVLRRASVGHGHSETGQRPAAINFSGWTIDLRARNVVTPAGKEVILTTTEFDVLKALAERRGQTVDRHTLYEAVKGKDWSPFDRSLDTHIANLRRKLDGVGQGRIIKTVHGLGYILAVSE